MNRLMQATFRRSRRKFLEDLTAACGSAFFTGASALRDSRAQARTPKPESPRKERQQSIRVVGLMPNLPAPYQMRDWKKVAQGYDAFAFDFNARGKFLPVIAWDDHPVNYHGRAFSIVSYVGFDPRKTGGEAINALAAVVGATLSGINKSDQHGHNFVAMCQKWFASAGGTDLYLNTESWVTGRTFWYELLPNILFYQLNHLYPRTGEMPQQMLTVADRYYQACVAMGGRDDPWQVPDFNHLSFSFSTMTPTDNGRWREPDAAAGIAWLEYMAWNVTRKAKYLRGAKWGMDFLNKINYNPFYEVLLPYGAYLAARMNAEQGTDYDTGRLVSWCFDGTSRYRRGWGVLAGNANGAGLTGLVGSKTDGDGYGFAMNTFETAGTLVPMVRYDTRFAHDVGKWVLNLANAARLFYSSSLDGEHQSNPEWTGTYDRKGVIPYEGIRHWKRGAATALSDYATPHGRIVLGNFASTHYREEAPQQNEVLEEARQANTFRLEHIWEFDLPDVNRKWLVVSAHGVAHGGEDGVFRFSYAGQPEGPYSEAFAVPVSASDTVHFKELPADLKGRAFVKAESRHPALRASAPGRLSVDTIQVSYQSRIEPFAQGDTIVSFVALINRYTVPIVLYRPQSAITSLALYGGSHVGILGGIVATTNVEKILKLDLLKTDYYRAQAFPTYLVYNPYPAETKIQMDVGPQARDLYDAVRHRFVMKSVQGRVVIPIPADSAVVVVLAPAGGSVSRDQRKLLVNGVVVDYAAQRSRSY